MTEWVTALCLLCVAQTVVGLNPEPPPMLVDMSASMWIKKTQLPWWPPYSQQVSHQRWIWGIHCAQVRKHARKGSILALKPSADVTRSPKQGYQWPHKKDLCLPKIKKKSLVYFYSLTTAQFLFKLWRSVWTENPHEQLLWPSVCVMSRVFPCVANTAP